MREFEVLEEREGDTFQLTAEIAIYEVAINSGRRWLLLEDKW